MTKISTTIKKYFPDIVYKIALHFRTLKINPYKLRFKISLPAQLSDLFIYSNQFSKVQFTAENTLAILLHRPIVCTHRFTFFDSQGSVIDFQEFETSDYILSVEFRPLKSNDIYISFCHHIQYTDEIINQCRDYFGSKITMLHRGYTSYWRNIDSIPHVVHGNFGAITEKLILTSRLAALHSYTPSFCFKQKSVYHLVFTNPCDRLIRINLQDDSGSIIVKLKLMPLATTHFELKNYDGIVHILSQLPICRPLIFQNPPSCGTSDFDVLHS